MITLNALTAADGVIIPVQAQYLPAKGMTQLLQTVSKVAKLQKRVDRPQTGIGFGQIVKRSIAITSAYVRT